MAAAVTEMSGSSSSSPVSRRFQASHPETDASVAHPPPPPPPFSFSERWMLHMRGGVGGKIPASEAENGGVGGGRIQWRRRRFKRDEERRWRWRKYRRMSGGGGGREREQQDKDVEGGDGREGTFNPWASPFSSAIGGQARGKEEEEEPSYSSSLFLRHPPPPPPFPSPLPSSISTSFQEETPPSLPLRGARNEEKPGINLPGSRRGGGEVRGRHTRTTRGQRQSGEVNVVAGGVPPAMAAVCDSAGKRCRTEAAAAIADDGVAIDGEIEKATLRTISSSQGSDDGPSKRSARAQSSSDTTAPVKATQERTTRGASAWAEGGGEEERRSTTARPPTKIRWRNSGLTGVDSSGGFSGPGSGRTFIPPSPPSPGVVRSTLPPDVARRREVDRFYRNYNPMEGIVTAVVLGGFFAFVCLLVVYKTKCKPMWKNRRKRLHNTPATHSVVDNEMGNSGKPGGVAGSGSVGDINDLGESGAGAGAAAGVVVAIEGQEVVLASDETGEPMECCEGPSDYDEGDYDDDDYLDEEEYEYECIPLRSVFTGDNGGVGGGEEGEGSVGGGEEEEADIYFLDEFGNYVFPVTPPAAPGSCSCHPSEEDFIDVHANTLAAMRRRQSQGSAISNAYTVKSLPGAYLYIPLLASGGGGGAGGDGVGAGGEVVVGAGAGAGAGSVISVSSLSSVRRSLSDPEIHFAPPFGHPIILTVNPSSDNPGLYPPLPPPGNALLPVHGLHPPRNRYRHKLQQRSHSMQPDATDTRAHQEFSYQLHHQEGASVAVAGSASGSKRDSAALDEDDTTLQEGIIAIQIIQPTPNISPTCSLKSVNDDDGDDEHQPLLAAATNTSGSGSVGGASSAGGASHSSPSPSPSPTSSLRRKKPRHKVDRRVSFSEDSVDQDDGSGGGGTGGGAGTGGRSPVVSTGAVGASDIPTISSSRLSPHRAIVQQQMLPAGSGGASVAAAAAVAGVAASNIPFMNYLQVPGQQQSYQFVVPQLTQEARQAQTSPQARRRRATRLMKAGSFCSINSEGDGDIFGPTGELLPSTSAAPTSAERGRRKNSSSSGAGSKRPSLTPSQASKQSSADSSGDGRDSSGNNTQKSTFDLSDYTEFQLDDCRSDISDLFLKGDEEEDEDEEGVEEGSKGHGGERGELKNQGTLSEPGSLKSLSTDEEGRDEDEEDEGATLTAADDDQTTEPTIVVTAAASAAISKRQKHNSSSKSHPPYNNPEYDEIMRHHAATASLAEGEDDSSNGNNGAAAPATGGGTAVAAVGCGGEDEDIYASSSCSISIGSDPSTERHLMHHHHHHRQHSHGQQQQEQLQQQNRITVPVTIEHPPPEMRGAEAAAATATTPPTGATRPGSVSGSLRAEAGSSAQAQRLDEIAALASPPSEFGDGTAGGGQSSSSNPEGPVMSEEEELVRLVLVRDIGVQVCGDSPNLNSTRRFPHHRIMSAPRPINITSDLYPAAPPPLHLPSSSSSQHRHHPSYHQHSQHPPPLVTSVSAPASALPPASPSSSLHRMPQPLQQRRDRGDRRDRGAGSGLGGSEEAFPTEILF